MKNSDFFSKGLPKWPCLLVTGKAVTPEQAAEIIVRTDSWHFMSNDRRLEAELKEAAGLTPDKSDKEFQEIWAHDQKVQEDHGVLNLHYLHNSQIVSCHIGGPHGWCGWDGHIGCNTFNIGKWPDVKEVYEDWKLIAKTWPFLDLRCQLLSGESCEESTKPVVEFIIKGGRVRMVEPSEMLCEVKDSIDDNMLAILNKPSRQRESGCTMFRFKSALALAKLAVQGQP